MAQKVVAKLYEENVTSLDLFEKEIDKASNRGKCSNLFLFIFLLNNIILKYIIRKWVKRRVGDSLKTAKDLSTSKLLNYKNWSI